MTGSAGGFAVAGAGDNADISLTLTDTAAAAQAIVVSLGNGNDSVNVGATLATVVAGILSATGGGLPQHVVGEFTFQGNTYFLEQANTSGSAFAAGDTLAELIGVQTFTSATTVSGAGTVHLRG